VPGVGKREVIAEATTSLTFEGSCRGGVCEDAVVAKRDRSSVFLMIKILRKMVVEREKKRGK